MVSKANGDHPENGPTDPFSYVEIDARLSDAAHKHRADPEYCRRTAQELGDYSRVVGYRRGIAYASLALGLYHFTVGDAAPAVAALKGALAEAGVLDSGDQKNGVLLADIGRALGSILCMQGRYDEAFPYLTASLGHCLALDDAKGMSSCHNALANMFVATGALPEAVHQYTEALRISRSAGPPSRQIIGLSNRAELFLKLGDLDAAIADARQGIALSDQENHPGSYAFLFAVLCKAYRLQGDLAESRRAIAQAMTHLAQHPDTYEEIKVLSALGMLLLAEGNAAGAEDELRCALAIARQNGHYSFEPDILMHLAEALTAQGEDADARACCLEGLEAAERTGGLFEKAVLHGVLAENYERNGSLREALDHLRAHFTLEAAQERQRAHFQLRAQNARRELEQAQAALETARREAAHERQRREELEVWNVRLQTADAENRRLLDQLRQMALCDPLTGLYNRRYLHDFLERAFAEAGERGEAVPVAVSDIDRFKQINDTFSHGVGDRAVQTVADLFRAHCRQEDVVARFGGDELVLVLPGATVEEAQAVCERIRIAVADYDWTQVHPEMRVTVSIGLCVLPVTRPEDALALADARLYGAKRAGRNVVCCA